MENISNKFNTVPIEDVQALYFDKDVIRESGIMLRRLDHKGQRNYFTVTENNQLDKIYTSVTTFTKAVLPTSSYLLEWMKVKSKEEQDFILKSSSTYGTLMDILFNQLLIDKEINGIARQVNDFTMQQGLYSINQETWVNQLKRDCLSFAQFIKDYEVTPILVSCPLKSDSYGIAGTLDLLCEMNNRLPTKTIKPVRIKAIIDYKAKIGDMSMKSDRNGFWESECLQLLIYNFLIDQTFPDIKVDALINFSPKNWTSNFSYNMKDWTGSKTLGNLIQKFPLLFDLFNIDNTGTERSVLDIGDSISLNSFEDSCKSISLTEFINKGLAERMEVAA